MPYGIYTLGNDVVLDQIIALLNSIETHANHLPVCIIPYDDRLERLRTTIAHRGNPQVTIFSDHAVMEHWDNFARQAWDCHPTARDQWQKAGSTGYHRFGTHRRYCGFSGQFERFIYIDADTLLLQDPQTLFSYLDDYDCVVYDFQYKDLSHIYTVGSSHLSNIFPPERLQKEIFCSGLYASHLNLFSPEDLAAILEHLASGEAEILYPMSVDQSLINYMMMRCQKKICNLALQLPKEQVTGCCVTSPHFQEKNHLLYDHDQPLTYLHYIGLSSQIFQNLCQGVNVDFPYREIFLHYRYLKGPEQRPQFKGKAKPWNASPSKLERIIKKFIKKP
jgi:hypothetical protein